MIFYCDRFQVGDLFYVHLFIFYYIGIKTLFEFKIYLFIHYLDKLIDNLYFYR